MDPNMVIAISITGGILASAVSGIANGFISSHLAKPQPITIRIEDASKTVKEVKEDASKDAS